MRSTDRLMAPTRGTAAQAFASAKAQGAKAIEHVQAYISEVYRASPLVGLDAAIVVTQSQLETGGWTSPRWVVNRNPAGLMIASDDDPDPARWTGIEAASVHIWALLVACGAWVQANRIDIPLSAIPFRDRWVAKYHDPTCPTVTTIDDLNIRYTDARGVPQATWAWDAEYQDKLVQRSRVLYGTTLPDQEDSAMGMPIIPVHWRPVPVGAPNNPAGSLLPGNLIVVWHENGNPNSDADDEARFLLNGGGDSRVSYHFAVDHQQAYQMFALNELCWHAADGCNNPQTDRGCFRGIAIEHCQDRDPATWSATKTNGAILTAMIIDGHPSIHFGGREGDFSADRIETHQAVSETNKHCPDWMLNEGAIPGQIARVRGYLAMDAATTTTTTTAAPSPYPPTRIPAPDAMSAQGHPLVANDPKRFRCVQGGRFRTAPADDAPPATPSPYRAGRHYTFAYRAVETIDGANWLVSEAGSWAHAQNFEVME
jgi:N-acetylmuramoyl-L-alanine amidase